VENEVRIPVDRRQLRMIVYLIGPGMVLASAAAAWLGTVDLLALAAGGALQLSVLLGPVGVVGVVFFSAVWWFGFLNLKRGGSALVIDSDGIEPPATVGGRSGRITWSDVEGWEFGYVSGQPLVHIVLKDPYEFLRRTRNPIRRLFGHANIRMVGTPVSVHLGNLGVSFDVIDEALTRFSGITQPDEHDVVENDAPISAPTDGARGVSGPDRQHQWIWAGVLVGIVAVLMAAGLSTTGGEDMSVAGFPWWFAIAIGAGMVALMIIRDLLYGETPDLVACVTVTGETRPRESWIPTAMANELAGELRRTGLDARARYQPAALIFWAGTSLIGASIGSAGLGQVVLGGGTVASWTLIVVGAAVLFGVADAPRWDWVRRRLLRAT
jgi:hypothetical protein